MNWVALIPLLPALAFATLLPMTRTFRKKVLWLPVAAIAGSAVLSLVAFIRVAGSVGEAHGETTEALWHVTWSFAQIGGKPFDVGLALDPLAALMLVTVSVVGTCVQVYSLGYMHADERRGWYYAVLSLFTSAMLVLVLSDNLLLTFGMWELMGLCSYLLIGFWYELEAPRKASQKAFMTTRVGDLGFLVALFAIYAELGTFDIATVLHAVPEMPAGVALTVALGLLWAAMGKSAQVPLHVWLPDAMAGPTPASALIHAATMVAAGVFVVAKMLPVFEATPGVMQAMMAVGGTTALMAALLASVQHDVKKVLAYSTISQLGLMFVALGAGSAVAGLWHLTTHAFFKSLMFLGAGVIIHAAHTQDMRDMGGLARYLPVTSATFAVGALALAGVPPLSGFFSKDEIIAVLMHGHHWVALAVVLMTSALTAFYMTRLWFRVFHGPKQAEHLHEGHVAMVAPMVLLAAIAALLGAGSVAFSGLLGHEGEWPSLQLIAISLVVAGSGIGLGFWFYGRRSKVVNTGAYKRRFEYAYGALMQKFYFDLTYDVLFIRSYFIGTRALAAGDGTVIDGVVNGAARAWSGLATLAWRFDGAVIDGAVNGIGSLARSTGSVLRRLQTGRLQSYQRYIIAAVVLAMFLYVLIDLVKGA